MILIGPSHRTRHVLLIYWTEMVFINWYTTTHSIYVGYFVVYIIINFVIKVSIDVMMDVAETARE